MKGRRKILRFRPSDKKHRTLEDKIELTFIEVLSVMVFAVSRDESAVFL